MDYQKAARIRKKGLLSLIAEKKFQEGQSLGSSIGGAISEKFKAKSVGLKEKLDPLNWVSSMVGKGTFGKVATTMAGRAFGRDESTIKYFGGYGKKKKRDKKDPLRTTIGSGSASDLKSNDSVADVFAKMYNFMEKTYEVKKKNDELEQLFRDEQIEEDERRHKKLIEAVLGSKTKPEAAKQDDDKSWIEKMLDGLKNALAPILGLITSLSSLIIPILTSLASTIMSAIVNSAGLLFNAILPLITSVIKKIIGRAFSILASVLPKSLSTLAGPIGIMLGALGLAKFTQENQETSMGPEAIELEKKHAEELLSLPASKKAAQNTTYEEKGQLIAVQARQRDDLKKVVEKFENETLTPAMEKIGFKPKTGKNNRNEDGSLIYLNDKNEEAGFIDKKRALHGEDWVNKLMMKTITGEEISPQEYSKRNLEEFAKTSINEIQSNINEKIKPLLDKFNMPSIKDPSDTQEPEGSVEVHQHSSVNTAPGSKAQVINTASIKMRNEDLTRYLRTSSVIV